VVASLDTYLRFAEAVNRLDLGAQEPAGLPEVVEDVSEAGSKGIAKGKIKGAIDAGIDKLQELLEPDGEEEAESASACSMSSPLLAWAGPISSQGWSRGD
jgi:hypothetical protein